MNQTAAHIEYQPELIECSVAEQLMLNRGVVATADDEGLRAHVHPARWERRGFLQRLRRRTDANVSTSERCAQVASARSRQAERVTTAE